MRSFAAKSSIGRNELDEFVTAIGEALANAIEHSNSSSSIELSCSIEHDKVMATIVDSGNGFDSDPSDARNLPDPLTESGRGLPIMRSCSDIFAIRSVPGKGTAIVLGRYLRKPRSTFPSVLR